MVLGLRYFQKRLALACIISACATSVSVADVRYDYTVKRANGAAVEGTSTVEPVDPERCGSPIGWIEKVSSRIEVEAVERRVPWENPVRVRRGGDLEILYERPFRFGRGPAQVVGRHHATMKADYTGCVVPSGKVLVSIKASISIDTGDEPKRFVVTYEGPPMPIKREFRESDTTNFKVETELGDAIVSLVELPSSPSFSTEPHESFWIILRIEGQGAAQ